MYHEAMARPYKCPGGMISKLLDPSFEFSPLCRKMGSRVLNLFPSVEFKTIDVLRCLSHVGILGHKTVDSLRNMRCRATLKSEGMDRRHGSRARNTLVTKTKEGRSVPQAGPLAIDNWSRRHRKLSNTAAAGPGRPDL